MTRLSNRQFPMMQAFVDLRGDYMSIADAQAYDQRPFRSMLIRKWIVYRHGRGFHLTPAGQDAWNEFHTTSIARLNPAMPLTAYFDPTAYGLKDPYKKIHVLKKRSAA